jgi:hypothetical protein
MKRVAMLVVVMALAGTAWGGPGDYYLGGSASPGVFSPYWRTITVFGSVETNDVMIFMDKTGAKVRATNIIDQVGYWARYAISNSVTTIVGASGTVWRAEWVAGDLANSNNVTAVRTELTNSLAGKLSVEADTNAIARLNALTNTIATAWQNPASATNWTWTSDGVQITLTGYSGPADVVVPDRVNNLPVTSIGIIFAGTAITSISGGENVVEVTEYAFMDCESLLSVSLQSTKVFKYGAFWHCHSLKTADIDAATTLGQAAFLSCDKLERVAAYSVTNVGIGTFSTYSTNLTSVFFAQNAPQERTAVYADTTNATNYVTNPQATGWGATWCGRPVVRLPVTSDLFTGSGASLTNIPIAGVTGLQSALDGKLSNGQTNVVLGLASGTTVETATAGSEPVTLDQALSLLGSSSTLYLSPSNCTVCPQNTVTNRTLSATPSATAWTIVYSGSVTNGQYLFSFTAESNEVATILAGNQTANLYMTYAETTGGSTLTCKMEGYIYDPATSNSTEYAETATSFSVARSTTRPTTPTTPIAVIPADTNLTGDLRYQIRIKAIVATRVASVTMWGGSNSISSVSFPVSDSVTLGSRGAINATLDGVTQAYNSTTRTFILTNTPAGIAAAGGIVTNSIPGPGCTDLGATPTVTITGLTVSQRAAPTGVYTVSVAQAASRYTYALEVVSTNPCTLAAGLNLQGSWTITGTNILAIVPCTGTLWRVYGRGL